MAGEQEDWKIVELREAERVAQNAMKTAMRDLAKQVNRIEAAFEVKKKVIPALREKPETIFGTDTLFIRSKNSLLAHDVVSALGIQLERRAESDGINYVGNCGEVRIWVYGMDEAPGCKIVRKRVTKEVEQVELVCDEKEASS